jgi:hypothetical protein
MIALFQGKQSVAHGMIDTLMHFRGSRLDWKLLMAITNNVVDVDITDNMAFDTLS